METTRAEAIAASLVAALAGTILAAYAADSAGMRFLPWPMLAIGVAAGGGPLLLLWRAAAADARPLLAWAIPVAAVFAWLLWLARPDLLPLGTGPDLTHHLQLIRHIDTHWRLVHDPVLEPFLGEMAYYTPGAHLLTSLCGAWFGSTGLHALQPLLSLVTALKFGMVILIGRRLLPAPAPRDPLSIAAALTLFAVPTFFLGAFLEFAFVAQVVAELFAVFAWWTLVAWIEERQVVFLALFGLAAAALFLTWPVLIGPPLLLLGLVLVTTPGLTFALRVRSAFAAAVLPGAVAAWFMAGRTAWIQLAGTGGKTAIPRIDAYGWPFLAASSIGLLIALGGRRTRSAGLMAAAVLTQAGALAVVALRQHHTPYMAQKMFYVLLFVQAVGIAALAGTLWQALGRWRHHAALAWGIVAIAAGLTARTVSGAPRRLAIHIKPAVTRPLERAGEWARTHLPPQCVDYLVGDDEAAYWLHLAVLGNPRMSARTGDFDTYELNPALIRWLTPGGLPYAIADLPAVPRGVREEFEVLARFETAAVVKRRGKASCPAASP
jgi:hypothetical protein